MYGLRGGIDLLNSQYVLILNFRQMDLQYSHPRTKKLRQHPVKETHYGHDSWMGNSRMLAFPLFAVNTKLQTQNCSGQWSENTLWLSQS